LTFFFREILTPTWKNPFCRESHHQYPNSYPFPWMGKSQYLCHLEKLNSRYKTIPAPCLQLGAISLQQDTLDPLSLHHPIVPPPQFIEGLHQEEDTRYLFCFCHLQMTHLYNQQAI
jgi:hypothetical protein